MRYGRIRMENPLSRANPRATADGLFRLLVIENNATEQEFKELQRQIGVDQED
jgi:hypothetical protein